MIQVGDTYDHDNNYYKITKVNFKEREVYIQNIDVNKSYDTDVRTFENIFWSWYLREKKRADELEVMLTTELEENYQLENKWHSAIERVSELETQWSELEKYIKRGGV